MSLIALLAILVMAVLAALAAIKKGKQDAKGPGFPYKRAKALFSAAERSFLGVLDQAVGSEHRVFGKVRVADVATTKPGLNGTARQGALNRIALKHFDFVVCRASDLSIVCAVELNDKSHMSPRAQGRDDLLAKVCKTINLPLLTFSAAQAYSVQETREQFVGAISPPPTLYAAGDVGISALSDKASTLQKSRHSMRSGDT